MNWNKRILFFSTTILLIGVGFWYYSKHQTFLDETYNTFNDAVIALVQTNSDVSSAGVLNKEGKHADALAIYEKLEAKAQDPILKGTLNLFIANEMRWTNITGAIQKCKQVSTNTSFSPEIRAYGAECVGRKLVSERDSSYIKEVFKDEPYASLFVEGNEEQSRKNVFDYAISLYPLAFSEFDSANIDAKQLVTLKKNSADPALIEGTLSRIEEKIKAGDADYAAKIHLGASVADVLGGVQLHKAILIGTLSVAGYRTQAEAELEYKKAIEEYEKYNASFKDKGVARLNYARFLANSAGDTRVADIHNLLSPLYTDARYSGTASLLKYEPEVNNSRQLDIQLLASLDEKFKEYLVTLGWGQNDF